MRFEIIVLAILAVLVTGLAGCKSDSQSGGKPASVEGVTWQLTEVGGVPAEPVPADARAASFVLNAADHRVAGYSGINAFNGTYQVSGEALRFGPAAMTRRAGPAPLMRQEDAFLKALMRTAAWRGKGDGGIELLDPAGQRLARFKRAS